MLLRFYHSWPDVLSASLEGSHGIKPKIKILQDVGLSLGDIWKISSSTHTILRMSLKNNIIPSLVVLKGMIGSNGEVAKVIKRSPWLLTANLENTLVPNVEFLKSYGISMDRILIILTNYPACFGLKPEVIRESLEKAKEMGLKASSKNFIYAIPAITSMSKKMVELKLQGLRDLGFSNEDISTMFRKAPNFVSASNEKMMKITELLLGTGKYNISSIVNCPKSLEMSIPNRYIPRLQILEALENRNLIKEWPALGILCRLTDDMFFKQFIRPYAHRICDSHQWQKGISLVIDLPETM